MATVTTVPVSVTSETTAYVAELGMQKEFEQMLEHTRQHVPGLRRIEVTLQPPYDLGGGPCVLIEAMMDDPHLEDDPTQREWAHWKSSIFPYEVGQHFVLLIGYGLTNAR